MPRLPLPVLLLGALLAGGCSHAGEPLSPALTDGSQSVDAQLGDTVRIVLAVTNTSHASVLVGMQNCNGDFVLVDRQGRVFQPAEYWPCRFALLAPQPLAPGASRRLPIFTTGLVVPEGSQEAPAMLPAGTYRVQSTVRVFEGSDRAIIVRPVPSTVTFHAP